MEVGSTGRSRKRVPRVAPLARLSQRVLTVGLSKPHTHAGRRRIHLIRGPRAFHRYGVNLPNQEPRGHEGRVEAEALPVLQQVVIPTSVPGVYSDDVPRRLHGIEEEHTQVSVGQQRVDVYPPEDLLAPSRHMARHVRALPITAPGASTHQSPAPHAPVTSTDSVQVGESEAVAELVREDPDLVDRRSVTRENRLDRIVVDKDESAVQRNGRRRKHLSRRGAELPVVRPHDSGPASAALGARGGMHYGQEIHVAVVVAGVGHTVGPIVVVIAPVDASVVGVDEELDDEFADVVE